MRLSVRDARRCANFNANLCSNTANAAAAKVMISITAIDQACA
jgi:hypothetical protein